MMRLPEFSYLAPVSVGDAVKLMADHGPAAMFVAGGTDLYPNMKRRQFEPSVLIGLRGIRDLSGVRGSSKMGLTIGAGTSLTAVSSHPDVTGHYAGLATAAGLVSSPQLRNMGTLGGNVCVDTRCNYYNQSYEWRKAVNFCMKKDGDICLVAPGSSRCWAVSSSDTAPMLWSLSARVRLAGPEGERLIPVSALYQDDGIQYLSKQPGEVVTDIVLPPSEGWRSAYLKLRRRGSFDFPVLGVAVALRMEDDIVREAAITLGAVASQPRPAPAAAALLVGQRLTTELIDAVSDAAFKPGKPLDNTDLTHPYRKKMIRVFVSRALRALADGQLASTNRSNHLADDEPASTNRSNHLAHGQPAATDCSNHLADDEPASTNRSNHLADSQPTSTDCPNHLAHGQHAEGHVEDK